MTGAPSVDRVKLAKTLALLGSPYPGERDAAAMAAMRIIRSAGLSWEDVLLQQNGPRLISNATSSGGFEFQCDMATCQRHRSQLPKWELDFVCSLVTFRRRSPKQLATLARIAAALREQGFG